MATAAAVAGAAAARGVPQLLARPWLLVNPRMVHVQPLSVLSRSPLSLTLEAATRGQGLRPAAAGANLGDWRSLPPTTESDRDRSLFGTRVSTQSAYVRVR